MISVFPANTEDFSTIGLATLQPTECIVEERAGGLFELSMKHPVDDDMKWTYLQNGCILKVPCAMREAPIVRILDAVPSGTTQTKTRKIYKVSTPQGGRLHLRARASTSSKILHAYKPGTTVVQLKTSGSWSKVSVCKGGATGWMWTDYLTFVKNETETVSGSVEKQSVIIGTQQTREQLFRIYSVAPSAETGLIEVKASHIFYDLSGVICTKNYEPNNVAAETVLNTILSNLSAEHDFEFHCSIQTKISGDYTGVSLVKALLDPEIGIVPQTNARIVRDNYDVYIIADEPTERGMEIRHRKNLLGATLTTDVSSAVTRIRPVGKDKDGKRLLITDNGGWVESENKALYPTPRDAEIEYDVSVSTAKDAEYKTNAAARAKLKELAEADFANGADAATVSLDVKFAALENTQEYADYAPMLTLFLYDTVKVVAAYVGISAKLRVSGYTYNCLLKRYDEIQCGELTDVEQTVYGYEIASGSVSGTKLLPNSVNANTVMRNATIGYAKIAQATVEQLCADSITAVRAHINELVTGSLTTDQLYADLAVIAAAQITAANIEKANIDWASIATLTAQIATIAKAQITTANIKNANIQWAEIADLTAKMAEIADAKIDDAEITTAQIKDLEATLANIVTAKIGTADIGFAQIKDLTAGTAIITEGVGGKLYISRLAVTEANMVSLTVGELIVKGSDGSFYAVSVDEDGNVKTTLKQIGNADVKDLSINAGEKIIEGSITAACLNAEDIFADNAIIRQLIAANMDVGTLFANDAFISHLNTADISGNEYLKLSVSNAVNSIDIGGRNLLTKTREFTPTTAAGTKIDDTYRDLAVRYLDCTALESGYRDLAQWSNVVYPEYGERYALSFYAKGSGDIETYFNGGTGYVKVKIIADSIEIRPSGDAALYVDSAGNAMIGALTVDADGNATLAADEDGNERLTVDAAGNATLAAGAGGSAEQTEDADESTTSDTETYGDGKCAFELSENWTRYWVVYECASTGTRTVGKHVVFRVNHGDKAYVCGAKLEKGSVATDWSPAPEDAEGEISSLKTRVSAAELKITPDAIAATVKEKIEFGGRNLYKGTKDFSGSDWYNKTGWTEDGAYNGCTAMKHSEAWMGLCQDCTAEVGEYTLSAWAKCSVASTVNAYFVPGSTSSGSATVSQEYVTIPDVGTQWKRISATFNVTAAGNLRARFELTTSSKTLWICGLKLEKGSVATDWSPAPEDAEGEIGSLKNRVSAAETKITPTAIVSTVTSSESYQSLSSTASTAQSTADTAKANAATAQSTADTAKTNAATAQSTANSAKSKADTNESNITALTTRVSQAELKITPTAIAATVREKIEFGGRNLLTNTKDFGGNVWYNKTGWTEDGTYNGCTAMKHSEAWMGLCQDCAAEVGEYTLSAWAKCSVASTVNAYFVPGSTSSGSATVSQEYVTIPDVGTQWKRISATFNVTAAGNLRARFELTTSSKTLWVCGMKLEKGSVATDWSPAPEDAADSVYIDSSYSKVEINKDRVRIVSTQMEVAVPSEDGEDDVMRVDKDGVHAEVVETDMVVSDSVVSTQGDASYTPADAGALAEILEELSGRYLTGVLSIDCKNVSSGSFEVQNVRGPGRIGLQNGTMNGLKITSCDCGIYCSGTTFSTAGTGVMIENSERVHFSSCVFNAGVGIQLGSNWRSRARMTDCTGTCTVLAKLMLCSELDIAGSSKPTGTLDLQSGSQVYNATSDPNFTAPSSGSVPTTQVATVSLSPTSTSTSGHSGLGSKLYQGRYSSSQSFRKGVMLFTLPSDLTSAANIESATLTIKRVAGVGGGGSVVAQIRCYDQTGTLYASKSVQNGQTVSIDVTSAVKAMKTSGYTGLMLYNPDTTTVGSKSYTTGYARFAGKGESGAPVLKVTYKK